MKRLIAGVMMSILMLTGCTGMNASVSQIGEVDVRTPIETSFYVTEGDNMIAFSDLEEEFRKNGIKVRRTSHEDALIGQYNVVDNNERTTILVDTQTSSNNIIITAISISIWDENTDLSQHPVIKIIANMTGEINLLTWVADREEQIKANKKDGDIIQDLLAMDRCYLFFEHWAGSESRTLEFTWVLRPNISMEFDDIAKGLEKSGLLATSYIDGIGGQTLTVTNSQHYFLARSRYFIRKQANVDPHQSAAYRVMRDKNKPNGYSVQLYGHMKGDLSYKTKVEHMPGLDAVSRLMNVESKDFYAITDKINEELTRARTLLNDNLQREYYSEGDIGGYHYIVTVPEGIEIYSFTALIEKR